MFSKALRAKTTAVLVLLLLSVVIGCEKKPAAIYFVPVGDTLTLDIEGLQSYYRHTHNLVIQVLPSIAIDDSMMDSARGQLVAEKVVAAILQKYPEAKDPKAVVIALTAKDMRIEGRPDWDWAFAYRDNQRFALVSNARMTPSNYGLPPDRELMQKRMRKMVTKQVAILYYGKSMNTDPKSVLYGEVYGLDELDAVGEDF